MAKTRLPSTILVAYGALALWASAIASPMSGDPMSGDPVSVDRVREAMVVVEDLLARHHIDVRGYSATVPPEIELVAASHEYLQGADGGYVDGHVYLNADMIADCLRLTLVHELVHDATVKHRLFAEVSNSQIRDVLEALADVVTAAAAEDPYRPGCLPRRPILVGAADLASLASPAPRR